MPRHVPFLQNNIAREFFGKLCCGFNENGGKGKRRGFLFRVVCGSGKLCDQILASFCGRKGFAQIVVEQGSRYCLLEGQFGVADDGGQGIVKVMCPACQDGSLGCVVGTGLSDGFDYPPGVPVVVCEGRRGDGEDAIVAALAQGFKAVFDVFCLSAADTLHRAA